MKRILFITALSLTIGVQGFAQGNKHEKAPEKIVTAFNKKFPNATKVKWEREHENEWEAEFKMDGQSYAASFDANGMWQETEREIKKSEIPTEIMAILDQNFSDYDIDEAEVVETAKGKGYEFEIEVNDEEFEVAIDANGNLTKTKEQEGEAHDED